MSWLQHFYLRRFSESRSSSGSTPSVRNTLGVPKLCNSKSFHSLLMIVHILKMCTSDFVHISFFFSFLRGVELRRFFIPNALGWGGGCLVCVICNSNSIHSFIFILYIMIVHTLKMCTSILCTFHYFLSFDKCCT